MFDVVYEACWFVKGNRLLAIMSYVPSYYLFIRGDSNILVSFNRNEFLKTFFLKYLKVQNILDGRGNNEILIKQIKILPSDIFTFLHMNIEHLRSLIGSDFSATPHRFNITTF